MLDPAIDLLCVAFGVLSMYQKLQSTLPLIPDTLPLFVPEAADETVDFQINAIVDALEKLKKAPAL